MEILPAHWPTSTVLSALIDTTACLSVPATDNKINCDRLVRRPGNARATYNLFE